MTVSAVIVLCLNYEARLVRQVHVIASLVMMQFMSPCFIASKLGIFCHAFQCLTP